MRKMFLVGLWLAVTIYFIFSQVSWQIRFNTVAKKVYSPTKVHILTAISTVLGRGKCRGSEQGRSES